MEKEKLLSFAQVEEAYQALRRFVHRTPLEYSQTFSRLTGAQVYLKEENLQKTGSFKIRGALNKIRLLSSEERKQGVIAASAGNHAQGVALAAAREGIKAIIVMPEGAPISKVSATKGYGAEVVLAGHNYHEAFIKAQELQGKTGAVLVHAFDDPSIMAGQGTVGLEIFEDLPEVEAVLVPVGGGGLISGVATALKGKRPEIRIIGVQSTGAPAAYLSRLSGERKDVPAATTIADGIAVQEPGGATLPLIKERVDEMVLVEDEEIAGAILLLLERSKLLVEGAGAVGLAALLAGKVNLAGKKTAIILSGGNIDVRILAQIIERGLAREGRWTRVRTLLSDRPGALQKLLILVAEMQGNILSVHHERLRLDVPLSWAEVELVLETRDKEHVRAILDRMHQEGYRVLD